MRLKSFLFTALAASLLSACATPIGAEATSRFDRFTTMQSSNFTGFSEVYLAPVMVSDEITARINYRTRGPNDRIRPLSQRDVDRAATRLGENIADALGSKAGLVRAPGAGVLTIAVTLTDMDANRPTQAEMADNTSLSMQSVALGGAAAAVVFSENGQVLATAMDSNMGDARIDTVSPSLWGEADQFYRRLSSKIASLLG